MEGWKHGKGKQNAQQALWGPVGPCVTMSAAWQDGRPCAILCDPVPAWQAVASCGKLCDPMLSRCAVKLWQIGRKSRKTGIKELCHC